jgi:hypothetical protein
VAEALVIDASLIVNHYRDSPDALSFLEPLLARGAAVLHPVVTLNDKHFKPIRGLSVVRPY